MMHELAHRILQVLYPSEYYYEGFETRVYHSIPAELDTFELMVKKALEKS